MLPVAVVEQPHRQFCVATTLLNEIIAGITGIQNTINQAHGIVDRRTYRDFVQKSVWDIQNLWSSGKSVRLKDFAFLPRCILELIAHAGPIQQLAAQFFLG